MAKGVAREDDSSHFTIIDVFDTQGADAAARWPDCVLVAHLEASLADGLTHELSVEIIDADNHVIAGAGCPLPITFQTDDAGRPMRRRVIIDLPAFTLPALGEYRAVLFAGGVPIGDFAFYLNRAEPPTTPPLTVHVHPRADG